MKSKKQIKTQVRRLRASYNLAIMKKDGKNIRTLTGFKTKQDAQVLGGKMYTILVKKLRQKVSFSIYPDEKKGA